MKVNVDSGHFTGVVRVQREGPAVSTWCPERQPVVQTSGFGGDEQIAEDTQSDDEGQENNSCYRETHKSSKTIGQRHRH